MITKDNRQGLLQTIFAQNDSTMDNKNGITPQSGEIIIFQTPDGLTKLDVQMQEETVWLTQQQMALLFEKD